jgi:hypothetical protein
MTLNNTYTHAEYHFDYFAFSLQLSEITQGEQKVSVHLMITIQKVTRNVQSAWQPTGGKLDSH